MAFSNSWIVFSWAWLGESARLGNILGHTLFTLTPFWPVSPFGPSGPLGPWNTWTTAEISVMYKSFTWIWNGVYATLQSGRYTLSYPRKRIHLTHERLLIAEPHDETLTCIKKYLICFNIVSRCRSVDNGLTKYYAYLIEETPNAFAEGYMGWVSLKVWNEGRSTFL